MKSNNTVTIFFIIFFSSYIFAQDGSLDTSFDTDGIVTTDIIGDFDEGQGVVVQSDGKIIVVGGASNGSDSDFGVVRYNVDGSLDTSFDTDGKVTTDFGGYDIAQSVAIQLDGKIIVVGQSSSSTQTIAVARYNTDGSLDTSFDTDGKVTTDFGVDATYGYDIAIQQSDGKIIVAGHIEDYTNNIMDIALVRYNTDGSLDTTFDTDGKLTTSYGTNNDYGRCVAIQNDGKIVVGGYTDDYSIGDILLVRYNTDGSLDTSFDTDGFVTTDFGVYYDYAYDIAIQSDGQIVIAGQAATALGDNFALARYNPDGSLDTSFDGDGKVSTDFGISYQYAYALAIQSDGKIIAAGESQDSYSAFAISRYNSDGSLDTSFDTDGKVTTSFGTNDAYCRSVAIQSDGKIVAAGYSYTGSDDDILVVRYNNSLAAPSVSVEITAFLEGPFNSTNMNASLTISTSSPYTEDPESVSSIPNILGNNVVDWVLVELRHKTTKAVIESQSAFILQDGSIVDLDGSSPVQFSQPSEDYFISVKHRNHLEIMSNTAITLNN